MNAEDRGGLVFSAYNIRLDSSKGPASDGRIKPDVCAEGAGASENGPAITTDLGGGYREAAAASTKYLLNNKQVVGRPEIMRPSLLAALSFLSLAGCISATDDPTSPMDEGAWEPSETEPSEPPAAAEVSVPTDLPPAPLAAALSVASLDARCNGAEIPGSDTPGRLVRCSVLPETRFGHTRVKIEYLTRLPSHPPALPDSGAVVRTSGELYVPSNEPLDGRRPVLVDAHGLVGLRPSCGPSVGAAFTDARAMTALAHKLGGAYVVVPDYTGLGYDSGQRSSAVDHKVQIRWSPFYTQSYWPFRNISHAYLSREGAGRALIDSVKAVHELARVRQGTGEVPRWFAIGHSEGGHAALAAGEVAASSYGDGLWLLGVVAGAPGTELEDTANVYTPVRKTLEILMLVGLSVEWPNILPQNYLTRDAMVAFNNTVNASCLNDDTALVWATVFDSVSIAGGTDLTKVPELAVALRANSPGYTASAAPIFVGQSLLDPIVQAPRTRRFVTRARATNAEHEVIYCRYPGTDKGHWTLNGDNHKVLSAMFPSVDDPPGNASDPERAVRSAPVQCDRVSEQATYTPADAPPALWDAAEFVAQKYADSL